MCFFKPLVCPEKPFITLINLKIAEKIRVFGN